MEVSFNMTLLMVLTVIAGISAQVLAEYLRVPGIVFLLLFGMVLGPSGLGVLHPTLLGNGLEVIVALSVALILFEGGLNLELRELGRVSTSLRNLVTIGTLITLVSGGMAAHWLSEFPWPIAFLFASLVVVTGPTVINPLLRQVKVDRSVATLLEGEGVLIDPVGAILAVVVLDIILNGDTEVWPIVSGLLLRLGIGAGIGAAGGWLLGEFLKRSRFLSEGLASLVVLAWSWGLFGLAQSIQAESGLMATVVAGIVLRASEVPEERLIRRFKGQLTILCVSVLFILLSADLSIASLFALGWGGPLTVLTLMFLVRPLNVWLCTWTSHLTWRQKLFLSWVAPRGIVSASVASLFAILLTEKGINGGDSIKALVFLTIILTVFCQGLTAGVLAKILGITSTQATGAVIVGSNPVSRLIARLFQERGEFVVLIDSNAEACREAAEKNLRSFVSSALDAKALEKAGLPQVGTFLVLTSNGEVNAVVAEKAVEEFQPPRTLALFPPDVDTSTHASKSKVQQAFLPGLSLKVWNDYMSEGSVKLGETVLREQGFLFQQAHLKALIRSQELLPLLLEREDQLQVIAASDEWRAGDRIIYLLHAPKPVLLKRLSGDSKQDLLSQQADVPLVLEKLPAVEEVPVSFPFQDLTIPSPPSPSTVPVSAASAPASGNGQVTTPPSVTPAMNPDRQLPKHPSQTP